MSWISLVKLGLSWSGRARFELARIEMAWHGLVWGELGRWGKKRTGLVSMVPGL